MVRTRPKTTAGPLARWLPVLLVLLGFALRAYRLGDQNVWWDEGLAVWAVRKPLWATTLWTAGDVHPPLFFWTLWPWVRLVGETEYATRYMTVIWGLIASALAYAIGRRLGGPRAGLWALALLTVSRFAVWWSMELRMYTLAALAVLAAVYATVRWLHGAIGAAGPAGRSTAGRASGPGRAFLRPVAAATGRAGWDRWLALAVVASAAALYTVYLTAAALALMAGVVVWLGLGRRIRRPWFVAWLSAQAVVAILFVAWLGLALGRMQSWRTAGESAGLGFVLQLWGVLLATGESTDLDAAWPASVLFWMAMAVAVIGLWRALVRPAITTADRRRRSPVGPAGPAGVAGREAPAPAAGPRGPATGSNPVRGPAFALLAMFLLASPLMVWLATLPRSIFYSPHIEARYFLPFAGPVYVLAGWSLAMVWRGERRLRLAGAALLTAAVVGPLLAYLPGHYAGRHLTGELYAMCLAIWTQAEPGDAVLLVSGNRYPLFHYYYDRPWLRPWFDAAYEFPQGRPPRWADRPPVIDYPSRGSDLVDAADAPRELQKIADAHRRIWLVEYGRELQDPDRQVEAWLTAHLPRVLSEAYGADALHLYDRQGAEPRVTGLSSRLPGTRWLGTDLLGEGGRGTPLPLIGLVADKLVPGAELDVTLFAPSASEPISIALGLFRDPLLAVGAPAQAAVPVVRVGPSAPATNHGSPAASADANAAGRSATDQPRRIRLTWRPDERAPGGRLAARMAWTGPLAARSPPGMGGGSSGWFASEVVAAVRMGGSARPASLARRPASCDAGFASLQSYGIGPGVVGPGQPVVVELEWSAGSRSPPLDPPVVFAHLVGPLDDDAPGRVVATDDGAPSSGDWPWRMAQPPAWGAFDRHVLATAAGTPRGVYAVEVGLYDRVTGTRYPVSCPMADTAERRIRLGTVLIR